MIDITSLERYPAEAPRPSVMTPPAPPAAPAAVQPVAQAMPSEAVTAPRSSADVRFEVDDQQRVVIRISDPATGEVVRQIPSEVLLRVADMITDARGGTVDAEA